MGVLIAGNHRFSIWLSCNGAPKVHGLDGKALIVGCVYRCDDRYDHSIERVGQSRLIVGTGFLLFGYDQGVMSGIITSPEFNDLFTATKDNSTMQGFVTAIYELGETPTLRDRWECVQL